MNQAVMIEIPQSVAATVTSAKDAVQKQAQAPVGTTLTAAMIASVLSDSGREAKAHADAAKAKWRILVAAFDASAVDVVKKACSDYVADVGKECGWKAGKGAPPAPPKVKTARVRSAEVKILYGAQRFAGLKLAELGLHTAITRGREALAVKGVKWDGSPLPTSEDRKLRKLAKAEAAALEAAAEMARKEAVRLGRTLTPEERTTLVKEADDAVAVVTAADICNAIIKKYGVKVAETVINVMPEVLNKLANETATAQTV